MTRIKRGTVTKRRHKKLLKQTKGYWGQRKNVFMRAKETLLVLWLLLLKVENLKNAICAGFLFRELKQQPMRKGFHIAVLCLA